MKRWVSYIIVFIAGIVLGIILCMALAFYNIHQEMGKTLIGPRIFGDIRVVPAELPAGEKALSLEKDKVRFMVVIQDPNGTTKSVSTVNKAEQGGYMMQPLQGPGEWMCSYGCSLIEEKVKGELYLDLNFDGQFDTKYVFDGNGKKVYWIFFDGDWHKVVGANYQRARDDSITFRFDPNSGWLQNDANFISNDSVADGNQKLQE
jgi:hypothetical protein